MAYASKEFSKEGAPLLLRCRARKGRHHELGLWVFPSDSVRFIQPVPFILPARLLLSWCKEIDRLEWQQLAIRLFNLRIMF